MVMVIVMVMVIPIISFLILSFITFTLYFDDFLLLYQYYHRNRYNYRHFLIQIFPICLFFVIIFLMFFSQNYNFNLLFLKICLVAKYLIIP